MSTPTTLPVGVVETDRKLQKSADELAKLRWHWTLDESNPDRVSFAAYARDVGVDQTAIRKDARAYEQWLTARRDPGIPIQPGEPTTVDDFKRLSMLSEERQAAAKAVARASGNQVGNVAHHKGDEVDAVVATARERAVDRGTTVEHEIERAAEWREKARRATERDREDRKAAKTMAYVEIEGDLAAMIQRGRSALNKAKEAELTPELKELLAATLGKLRAVLNLIDLLVTDEAQVNWDAEFEKAFR